MRPPDLTIGNVDAPQTLRWHLWIPKWVHNLGFRLNLHHWLRSDDDRALHDHRGDSLSLILSGGYYEVTSHAWEPMQRKWYGPGSIIFRRGEQPHRVELKPGATAWTLWFRWPFRREWGFYCPKGWRHYGDYITERDYSVPGSVSSTGRGCD